MNNCSVLVCSCDKYEEAWELFFKLFDKYWKDCPFSVYLTTETKKYELSERVKTINTGKGEWTRRINKALKEIKTDYVIIILEDFFFRANVKTKEISKRIKDLEENKDIACFYFNRISNYNNSSEYDDYYLMTPNDSNEYMLNCQIGLWRKSILEKVTDLDVNAWHFEKDVYNIFKDELNKYKFYCLKNAKYDDVREDDVFSYLGKVDKGYGIFQSKWLWNNKKLFKEANIKIKNRKLRKMSHIEFCLFKLGHKLKYAIKKIYN